MSQSPSSPLPDLLYYKTNEEPEALPVRLRPRTEYDALGIRRGSFLFYPGLSVSPFYDSNVFAAPKNLTADDTAIIFSPRLLAQSNFNNHALTFEIGMDHLEYSHLSSQSRTDARAILSGRLDVRSDLVVLGAASVARRHEQRGTSNSPIAAAEPVAYDDLDAAISVSKSFNRVEVSLGTTFEHRNYYDASQVGGGRLDQDFRDGETIIVGGRVAYAFRRGFRVFGDIRHNWRQYENLPGLNSDSKGYNLLTGVEFALSTMMRGEIGIGYMRQDYDAPNAPDATGLSYSADLIWTPTPLVTVGLEGSRVISDTGIAGSSGRIDTSLGVTLDYELRRNLILSPSIGLTQEEFAGISRTDWMIEPRMKVDYLINRYFSVGAEYAYTRRNSSISANDFERHIVRMNAEAKF